MKGKSLKSDNLKLSISSMAHKRASSLRDYIKNNPNHNKNIKSLKNDDYPKIKFCATYNLCQKILEINYTKNRNNKIIKLYSFQERVLFGGRKFRARQLYETLKSREES